jgi:hypothetical protein
LNTQEPQTLEEYNRDLEEGEEDFQNGKFLTIDELKDEMKDW